MATDLKDDATPEDIQKAVDQIVEDRRGDKTADGAANELGHERSDTQAIAEDRDEPTTQREISATETESDNEDTVPEDENAGEGQDWLDDDLRAETAAYGIGEEELADFTSREELERALRFFDRSVTMAGRKAAAEGEETQTRDERGRFAKEEPEPETPAKAAESAFEIALGDIWDEDVKAELTDTLTGMRDHYETRISAMEKRIEESEARFAEADASLEEQRFDNIVDSLGHADLFGKSGKENSKQLERRQDLFREVKFRQAGMEMFGHTPDINAAFVNRVSRMVFAEELGKKELKARTRKISKQANGRGGDSATKGASPVESLRDEMRRRYKELEGSV